jgi:zinc D-Ala-D-Ala dipeptidase
VSIPSLAIFASVLTLLLKNNLYKNFMKPYQQIPIHECHELLVEVPLDCFAVESPHPYTKLLAPYGNKSPYYLRQGVLERLLTARTELQKKHPGWQIQIFDAYRPIAVQQFMVDYMFQQVVQAEGLTQIELTESQRQAILAKVYQFWALPSLDPEMPPPHSTGAAVDVSLVNAAGQVVDMGSPIDEMSPRSDPNYYAAKETERDASRDGDELDHQRAQFHLNREILKTVMTAAGFEQHPNEWWHFSYGDQLWAWLKEQRSNSRTARYRAIYGAI